MDGSRINFANKVTMDGIQKQNKPKNSMLKLPRIGQKQKVEIGQVDLRQLRRQMRKYKPTNSSFSLFYGEKKQIEKYKAQSPNNMSKKQLSMVQLKRRSQQTKYLTSIMEEQKVSLYGRRRSKFLSEISEGKQSKTRLQYIARLSEIGTTSNNLTEETQFLRRKDLHAIQLQELRFRKLSDEVSSNLKNNLYGVDSVAQEIQPPYDIDQNQQH